MAIHGRSHAAHFAPPPAEPIQYHALCGRPQRRRRFCALQWLPETNMRLVRLCQLAYFWRISGEQLRKLRAKKLLKHSFQVLIVRLQHSKVLYLAGVRLFMLRCVCVCERRTPQHLECQHFSEFILSHQSGCAQHSPKPIDIIATAFGKVIFHVDAVDGEQKQSRNATDRSIRTHEFIEYSRALSAMPA